MKHRQSVLNALLYLLPCAVLFAVHYQALRTWFFMDDFAWLGLRFELNTPRDVWKALFEPRAQGTVRVLSERLFFIAFSSIFGMRAGPFHYWVFLTQCGSLILASAIVRRLSGSRVAGVAAATLWAVSHATSVPLAWLSAYNEILCGFFALAAFYCLIRFVETGEQRYWILQWIPYLLGFMALEVTVVYPAIAFVYVWLAGRQYWKKALWLWIPSLIFTAIHFSLIPKTPSPVYKMIFDFGILPNLGRYMIKAVGPNDLLQYQSAMPAPLGQWVAASAAGLLVLFLGVRLWKRDWLPLIGVAWFLFFIAPLLPLQNHVSDYYSTIPSFGLAMLGGWAFASALRSNWALRVIAVTFVSIFAWCELVQAGEMERWYRLHSGQLHVMLTGIEEIALKRQAEIIMLAGVDDELYISGLLDDPFRLYGRQKVYLVPGSEAAIRSIPKGSIRMRIDQDAADAMLNSGKAVVAAFDGRGIVDVTDVYRAMRKRETRITVVRLVDPVASSRLGPGWHDVENGYRWMPRRAAARLDTPSKHDARVFVSIYCPQTLIDQAGGRLEMKAFVEGRPIGMRRIELGEQQLVFDAIPADLFDKKELEITLEVSHVVFPPGDGRELGIPVYEIAIKSP